MVIQISSIFSNIAITILDFLYCSPCSYFSSNFGRAIVITLLISLLHFCIGFLHCFMIFLNIALLYQQLSLFLTIVIFVRNKSKTSKKGAKKGLLPKIKQTIFRAKTLQRPIEKSSILLLTF